MRVLEARKFFLVNFGQQELAVTKPKHPPGEIAIERNITRRCDGFAFRVRMMAQGIRYDETFHSLQDARAFRDRKRSDITLDPAAQLVHAARLARQSANLTLGELLKRYQAEVTPTKKGARAERLRINKLLRFPIAQLPARLVGREALLQFMKSPEEDWNGNNLRKYLMILSALFNVAIKRWGMALTNPVPSIEMPSNGPSRKRRLEDQEHEYLTASLRKSRSPYMAPLVQVAIETACRRGELLRLDWKDVDLKGRTATLRDTKNGEDRTIPLSSVAIKLLSELPGTHTGLVFPLREERVRCAFDMGKKRAQRQYIKDCQQSGQPPCPGFLDNFRFHDLRHEATSRLFEKGLDIMEASSITGHKTLAMLKNYTHLRAQRLAQKLG